MARKTSFVSTGLRETKRSIQLQLATTNSSENSNEKALRTENNDIRSTETLYQL